MVVYTHIITMLVVKSNLPTIKQIMYLSFTNKAFYFVLSRLRSRTFLDKTLGTSTYNENKVKYRSIVIPSYKNHIVQLKLPYNLQLVLYPWRQLLAPNLKFQLARGRKSDAKTVIMEFCYIKSKSRDAHDPFYTSNYYDTICI